MQAGGGGRDEEGNLWDCHPSCPYPRARLRCETVTHTQDLIYRMSQKVTEILALHVGARGAAKQRQDKRGPHKHPPAQVMHPTEPCRDKTTPTLGGWTLIAPVGLHLIDLHGDDPLAPGHGVLLVHGECTPLAIGHGGSTPPTPRWGGEAPQSQSCGMCPPDPRRWSPQGNGGGTHRPPETKPPWHRAGGGG